MLAAENDDFEESVMRACELVVAGDPRIGNVPKPRRARAAVARRPPAPQVKAAKAVKKATKANQRGRAAGATKESGGRGRGRR